MVPFWVLSIIWNLVFRQPKRGTIIVITTHILFGLSGKLVEVHSWVLASKRFRLIVKDF